MKTILDTAKTWFLESISKVDDLCIVLTEGIVGEEEGVKICDVEFSARPIETQRNSRKIGITFEDPVAWQVVDESFTTFDESEVRDDTSFLQALTKSTYLDYVNAKHGWYRDIVEKEGIHYRVWTENDQIDVVSCKPPKIEEIT